MKSSSYRRTTLLSLLGLGTAQSTSSWGQPFTVDNAATLSSSSKETLLASSSPASVSPLVSQDASSLSASIRGPPPIQTGVTRDSSFAVSSTSSGIVSGTISGTRTGSTATGAGVQSTGAAGQVQVGVKKMGVVGVMAGAAGVLFV
jgi:hypothetical protein